MTDCEKYMELMSAMLDGELSDEQEAELRTHIDKCEDCRRVYNAFKGISGALNEELVTPPEMLAKGVMFKINNQKKTNKRFVFGKFTALAACLALVLFGASHFGLLNGAKTGEAKASIAAPKMAENQTMMEDSSGGGGNAPADRSVGAAANDNREISEQATLTQGTPVTETVDGAVLLFGFSSPNAMIANEAGESKEPGFIFETKKMEVYEGKYYPEAEDAEKNKLLFSLSTTDDLNALYGLITALPDNSVEYTPEDGDILKSDPLYTLYIPANTQEDKDAKDKVICVWFVDGEVWCVIADAQSPDPASNVSAEKIIYKAEGFQNKFENFIKELKKSKNIT